MLRTSLYIILGSAALAAAIAGGLELRRREDARALFREARLALRAPLARAPEFGRIEAGRARSLLADGLELYDEPEARGLLAWADGLARFQKGEYDRARQSLAQAERLLPGLPELELLQGAVALGAGDRTHAEARGREALALQPMDARARLFACDLAADAGQTERALQAIETLIAENPQVGTLYNRRGLLHEAEGERGAAAADFQRASQLDPNLAQPHVNLGRLSAAQGRMPDAEESFARALEHDETAADAWLGRGLARLAQGDTDGARLDLERARELAPAEPDPLIALGDHAMKKGEVSAGVARYRAALALAPGNASAWLKLGNALTRGREFGEARAAFERALALDADLAAAHNGLGAALMGAGDHAAAEAEFAFAAALDQRDPNPLRNLALLREKSGDRRAAREARVAAEARRLN